MASSLWAVTCLFNSHRRSHRRIQNFRRFRRALGIPLVAVELAFEDEFELRPEDADVLIQLRGGDVMWQKERLLNLGVGRLPKDCDAVAILDSDIIFPNPNWSAEALAALGDSAAVQPFEQALFLDRESSDQPRGAMRGATRRSVASLVASGTPSRELLLPPKGQSHAGVSHGLAWVYRRDLLERHGLFEAGIVGGGDEAIAAAGFGVFEAAEEHHLMNEAQRRRYRSWAEPWYDDVKGRIGWIKAGVAHLWHGSPADRRSTVRHEYLSPHDFDPGADITSRPGEPLRWVTEKPALHRSVKNYFAMRGDDGPRPIDGVLVLRHPWIGTDFYHCVTDWVRDHCPEIEPHFSVRELPVAIEDDAVVKAVVMWVQEPLELWSPDLFVIAEALAAHYDRCGTPVINRPSITSRMSKSGAAPLIASAGFRVARMSPITDPAAFRRDFGGLAFPFFVRDDRLHQSQMLPARDAAEAAALPLESFASPVAVELIDVADPRDGLFRKYRYFACREIGVSHHLQVSRTWVVRGEGRVVNEQTIEEEVRYIGQPDPHHERFQKARRALGLDMAAFDYSYDHDGNVVVWEVNPFPYIRFGVTQTTHRNRAIHRSIAAMVAMYLECAGLEVPKSVKNWLSY